MFIIIAFLFNYLKAFYLFHYMNNTYFEHYEIIPETVIERNANVKQGRYAL